MLIQNRLGTRFELLLHPAASVASGVPVPYASAESFLSTFTAPQRAQMLQSLGSNSYFPSVDPIALRNIHNDDVASTVLVRLLRARHIAFRHPGAPVQRAPVVNAGARGEPASKGPATAPPAVKAAVVCELLAIEAACAHNGRKANKAGILEVVPGRQDDLIQLKSTLKGGCGEHPRWEVRTPFSSTIEKTGASSSFVAKSWGFKALGIFEVQPKTYYVNCTCCTGPTKQFEVRAYPIDEWELSVAIDLKKPPTQWSVEVKITPWEETSLTLKTDVLRTFNDKTERLKWALDKVMVPLVGKRGDWEFFKTKLKFSGKWAENEGDHRAFYKYTAGLELDPLLKGYFLIPFGPSAAIPPWIKKWTTDYIGDLYLYLKFEGEVKLFGSWSRTTADKSSAQVEGSGKITVKAGGNLFLMKKSALNLDVNGATSITAEAKAPVSRMPAVEYDLKWGGLEIELTIEAAWGLVEYKRKWKPIEGFSLLEKMLGRKPDPWYPLGH
nr:hypothetical protein [Deltaproteobacteria bacterium]